MGKFNLNQLLSGTSLKSASGEAAEKTETNLLEVTPISVHNLVPSKDNFYSVENISELKDSIEMFGIKQNLTVKPLGNGKYLVLAGHRRLLASLALVEEGKTEFELVPCCIENDTDYIKEQLLLITTNATARQLTDWEKVQQAEKIRELLAEYKKKEKLPGGTRNIIASILSTSSTQIARMDNISKKLTPEFKEEFKEEKINISTAYELSTLPHEEQQNIYKEHVENGTSPSMNDVKERKVELKEKTGEENKPSDEAPPEPIIIERVPEGIVQKLQELRMKVNQNEEADKLVIKFSIQFESLAKNFKEILETVKNIEDIENKEKCKGSINTLISKMMERL